MRELRKRGIRVAVMHTDVPSRSYTRIHDRDVITWQQVSDPKTISKFRGYLSNVAINKIMILNSCWPFVLSDQTHADLTIGIDVKNQTAGFTFVYKDQTIVTEYIMSQNNENNSVQNNLNQKFINSSKMNKNDTPYNKKHSNS